MKNHVKKTIQAFGAALCIMLIAFNMLPQARQFRQLPADVYVDAAGGPGELLNLAHPFSVTDETGVAVAGDLSERLADTDKGEVRRFTVELFGFPVKEVNVHLRDDVYLMPCGESVGVSLQCEGVLVVGLGNVGEGTERYSPAGLAGVRAGDVILAVNGDAVEGVNSLTALCAEAGGAPVTLSVLREGRRLSIEVTPWADPSGAEAKLGMWVRESTAGIGTLSFYVMGNLRFGALGHGVTDADTGTMIRVKKGEIVESTIVGVTQGEQGMPGEVRGTFGSLSRRLGSIENNTSYGVYGALYEPRVNRFYPQGVPLAYPDEITLGKATLLSSIDEGGVEEYDCEIVRLFEQTASDGKGMVIRITDRRLLEKTGGIVQGMSGSPVIQNGKLAGAVTHVFINDPQKGYGVYALWMYENTLAK